MNDVAVVLGGFFTGLWPAITTVFGWALWFFAGVAVASFVILGLSIARAPVLDGYYSDADTRDGRREPPAR